MHDWARVEIDMACAVLRARERNPGDADFDVFCHRSASKAFEALCNDGQGRGSLGPTKGILGRLMDGRPLFPVEDGEDAWVFLYESGRTKVCQSRRFRCLFREEGPSGVKYRDVSRAALYDLENNEVDHRGRLASDITDMFFPVAMPYMPPERPYIVRARRYKASPDSIGYDTIAVSGIVCPDGEARSVGKYYKDSITGWKEIDRDEFEINRTAAIMRRADDKL